MNREINISGFTLIELVIVLTIISLLLFFSVPVFKNIQIFSNSTTEVGKIFFLIEKLKKESVSENKNMSMHIDLSEQRVWVTTELTEGEKEDENKNKTEKSGLVLEQVRVLEVMFIKEKQYDQNECVIKFNRNGYSDMAIIHFKDEDENDITIIIEPFLLKAKLVEEYISFEDCI